MDVGFELLQLLLLRDAEMLLFIDDEQAEVFKLNARSEEGVGADDDIDFAFIPFIIGAAMAAIMPMIITTIISSINVKPFLIISMPLVKC